MSLGVFLRRALGTDLAPDDRALDTGAGPPGLAAVLAERTGVPTRRIRAMTLAGYAPEVTDAPAPSPGPKTHAERFGWFLPWARSIEICPKPIGP